MTRRVVLFKGQTNWMMTPEFIGDKDELAKESATRSCDKNWAIIARRFIQAKTAEEFGKASTWAQGLYHDTAGDKTPKKLRPFKNPDDLPDEALVVYEDLGVSGIQAVGMCPACGRTHFITYRPDKTVSSSGRKCLTCATKLRFLDPLPGDVVWAEAIDMYNKPAPSYRIATPDDFPHISQKLQEYAESREEPITEEEIATGAREWLAEEMRDENAAKNMGEPVKISKIVRHAGDEFQFEVLFRDWSTAVLRGRYLIPIKK